MNLYIYPNQQNPTEDQVLALREKIVSSLSNDSLTWKKIKETVKVGDVDLPLFTHIKEQYQNEPFYFRYGDNTVNLKFKFNKDENSKSMIIGMMVYYLRTHLIQYIKEIVVR